MKEEKVIKFFANWKRKGKHYLLPKQKNKNRFTLVLDLDETLVSAGTDEIKGFTKKVDFKYGASTIELYVKHRPYLYHFLTTMKKYAEIILFSASE